MLHRGALYLLILALALLASPTVAPPVAAQATLVVDDTGPPFCAPVSSVYTTIAGALAVAQPGDTIWVCAGDYTEPSMVITTDYLTITGPGATPGDDGVATVHHNGVLSAMFTIQADGVVLQGLDLDATPPWGFGGAMTIGIENHGSSVAIEHNEIRNATGTAVSSSGGSRYVQVLSNDIHDSQDAVVCYCDDSVVAGNTVNVTDRALELVGNGGNVTNNVVVNGRVVANGDDLFISTNQISGPGVSPLLSVSGSRVGVTDNTLSDAAGYGIQAQPGSTSTSVTIGRNTFTNINRPIRLQDSNPGDAFTLTATIGGSQAEANTFVESGGTLGDSNYLVQMDGPTIDVNAEYNKWGLCTLAEIEQEIYHQVDDPAQALVDFDPFIAASGCSTPTPTATPTSTPTPTPTAIPGPTRTVTIPAGSWANFAWTGDSSPQTVADCFGAGKVAVMYRLDAASGSFHRWIGGRDDLSNMGDVQRFDALLALNASAQPATCTMPDDVVPHSFTIPAGRWANFAWLANSFPAEVAPEACSEGSIAVIYRLDALTRTFQRWIRGRPELSNMTDVQPYDALLALNASGQPSTCTFTHYGQLAASSS